MTKQITDACKSMYYIAYLSYLILVYPGFALKPNERE